MSQFIKKLTIEDFVSKRQAAESSLKINLSEELRYLNKWVTEYEDTEKYRKAPEEEEGKLKLANGEFPYQPLFEQHSFESLKLIAKQVFVSPVYNWNLFSILKKRLETAYDIRQDLRYMLKELESGD